MKQPVNELVVFRDDGSTWIDVECGANEGGFCNVGISEARSESAAWRKAARRLRKLADEAERRTK